MSEQTAAEFDLDEARRVLGDVFAPWVQDLGLSIAKLEISPPSAAPADWQPGATLRMAFSERLCRNGGIVCGQALMALADTAMVIAILAANRGFRPMTTVDQTTHFLKAATVIGRAGGRARGPARPHHEFRAGHAIKRRRQQAGGDGLERVCDAVRPYALRRIKRKPILK